MAASPVVEIDSSEIDSVDFDLLSDHDLLAGARDDLMQENFYAARRLARLDEFRRRRERDYKARKANEPLFTLTPLQETVVEIGPLLGHEAGKVRSDLQRVTTLREHFPGVWELCRTGQLDLYRASMFSDAATWTLESPADIAKLAKTVTLWLNQTLPEGEGDLPLVTKTSRQLRNKLSYELKKLKPKDADEQFNRSFKQRRVDLVAGYASMGFLSLNHTSPDLQAADHHLTLLAKMMRKGGDERTLDQLRADLMLDLVLGRLQVGDCACDSSDAPGDRPGDRPGEAQNGGRNPAGTVRRLPTPAYARPIINLTVPIQTVMGLSDHPGVLSGGESVPASLVRKLAQDPSSTWYRMLTDPARRLVELSTTSYTPTKPIWRQVVADHNTCYLPSCAVPSTASELDHRTRWPWGKTSTKNLGPGCKRDHKAKHAEGFHLGKHDNGDLVLRTRVGFSHTTSPVEQPVSEEWPDDWYFESQFTATEILGAIHFLRQQDESALTSAAAPFTEEKAWADFRASYPNATDDDIHSWIYGDDDIPEEDHYAPPILKQGVTSLQVARPSLQVAIKGRGEGGPESA